MIILFRTLVGLLLVLTIKVGTANDNQPSAEELEAWFNSDTDLSEQIAQVNEGQLTFLGKPGKKPVYQAYNHVRLLPTSYRDGWVSLSQCHTRLDEIHLAQLVFPEYTLRHLQVTEQKGIESAFVEGKSVQLKNVAKDAKLCVTMQIQALTAQGKGRVMLTNGPFQRRFLDGYYPLNVLLLIDYSGTGLRPVMTSPVAQAGMKITDDGNRMGIDAHFEGVLRTQVLFQMETDKSRGKK